MDLGYQQMGRFSKKCFDIPSQEEFCIAWRRIYELDFREGQISKYGVRKLEITRKSLHMNVSSSLL